MGLTKKLPKYSWTLKLSISVYVFVALVISLIKFQIIKNALHNKPLSNALEKLTTSLPQSCCLLTLIVSDTLMPQKTSQKRVYLQKIRPVNGI